MTLTLRIVIAAILYIYVFRQHIPCTQNQAHKRYPVFRFSLRDIYLPKCPICNQCNRGMFVIY